MKIIAGLCCLCLFITACNSNNGSAKDKYVEVFSKYQPQITELRNNLSEIKKNIKEAGTAITPLTNTTPVIDLGNNDTTGNTLILQYHLLDHPETFTSSDSLFGLYYNKLASDAFKWTGITKERMILEQDYLKEEEVDNKITPLNTDRFPYLLIVKAISFDPLIHTAEETFTGGSATASFYLYDLKNRKELSSISLSAKPDEEMLYAYQGKDGSAGKYEAAKLKAKESMEKTMRLQVYNWLRQITGGTAIVPSF